MVAAIVISGALEEATDNAGTSAVVGIGMGTLSSLPWYYRPCLACKLLCIQLYTSCSFALGVNYV